MIEYILIISILFLIYAFFYKQYVKDYLINQIEFTKLNKLQELLNEKNPLVIHHCPQIPCVSPTTLLKTPRFETLLKDYLNKVSNTLPQSNQFETFLASETGFHAFGSVIWLKQLHNNFTSEYISSLKSKLCFGSKHMMKATALYTILIPVDGNYMCSLINPQFESELTNYKTITSAEQLVSHKTQVQYIDVKLKLGSILIVPTHWYYIMSESESYSYYGVFEYHEPISLLCDYLEQN